MKQTLSGIPDQEELSSHVRNKNALVITSYAFLGIDVVLLILLIWMRRRIQLAIGIIKEATKAIGAIPSLVVFPGVIYLLIIVFYIYWTVIAL